MDIDDEHLNDDIETEVLHMQGLSKNRAQLDTWRKSQNIEYCPGGLWWKDQALVVVGNDDLKRGVTSKFHDALMAGHPELPKPRQKFASTTGGPAYETSLQNISKDALRAR